VKGVPPAELIRLTPDPWTAHFWEATAEHRLVLCRCGVCSTYRMPPTPFCWRCRSQEVEWVEHGGNGTVYSFTVIRHAVIPAVKEALPLIAAVVELDDAGGSRLVGDIVDAEPDDVAIEAPVTVDWWDVREGVSIPVFRLAAG